MYILGISAYYHDSAACLIKDGILIAAAQEERFTRKKHDARFPAKAIEYCLKEAGITNQEIDHVVFYEKPWLKFERLLETYLAFAPSGLKSFLMAMPQWVHEKLWMGESIKKELEFKGSMIYPEHHQSHAASAFFPSPFESAAVLTLDGVGEWATSTWGVGKGNTLTLHKEIRFPNSLGLLYSALTYYTGFKVNSGEYKVMGLAPYGEPTFTKLIYDHLIDVKEDGSFQLNMEYFNYCQGLTMTSEKFHQVFGAPPRQSESQLGQREMDLARSIQDVTENVVRKIAHHIRKETGEKNLCLAGGVALNCVANGKILAEKIFDNIWIQPAAGDAGGALGAALFAWHQVLGKPRTVDGKKDLQFGSYLGPKYSNEEIASRLDAVGAKYYQLPETELINKAGQALADGKVVGWFSGRMEFGPRALGGRSIIGDARRTDMQSVMNLKIKFRESFRPFAPSCLRENVSDYFKMTEESPYMLICADVVESRRVAMTDKEESLFGIDKLNVPKSDIPAVTHVDYSARIQTVTAETNPRYHALISKFKELTGYGVIINTSFNVRGEPIVCFPEDAYKCLMRTGIDVLVLENCILYKEEQPELKNDSDWKNEFELD